MSPKVSDEHKETRRKEILEAAKQVFAQKGYVPATMKDVVEQSGMSRGGVYMYFSSTGEMMLALLEEEDKENYDQIEALTVSCTNVWEAIVFLLKGSENNVTEAFAGFAAAIYEFYLTRWREQGKAMFLEKRYDRALATLQGLLQKGIELGEFSPLVPIENITRVMISLLDGIMLDSTYLGTERIKLRSQLETALMMLRLILQVQSLNPDSSAKDDIQ